MRRSVVAHAGAKKGDLVKVHYTGTLDDGTQFDSSIPRDSPLEFIVGEGRVIAGFDKAVMGLEVGQKNKQRVEVDDAYGPSDPSMVLSFPAEQAPKGLEKGMKVKLSNGMIATCSKFDDKEIELDLNHELAGQPLTFEVELLELTPSERMQKATFGAGCFWGPELMFQRVPGVLATEVGYSNGQMPNPTYEDVCTGQSGHAEVVQVVFDPQQVSYEQLLELFFDKHDPTQLNQQGNDRGTQYRSGVYYHTPEQRELAIKIKDKVQAKHRDLIVTEIEPVSMYYTAEPYHQQYLAKGGRAGNAQSAAKGCQDPIRCYG
eukprot:CAMPEP_0202351266 /NCGR_PEP_ID=MMETSP1126-20121109/7984_1 /ASSEMBLY_ACC=CAM_ASM_000457 /TAXON_ID=3047 /ORGANISM="Dunaliella tertiolecta, Strain CCMP1320" /LENGTH=316 /DNA_ID=CAMNT_0048943357 /DNA_START=83 /DNA_END=1033 /DNA_ORIENTATION=-